MNKAINPDVFDNLPDSITDVVVGPTGYLVGLDFDHKKLKAKDEGWKMENLENVTITILGDGYDATDWKNSGLKRPSKA